MLNREIIYSVSEKTICFTAYLSSGLTNYSHKIVVYDLVETNKGQGYNTSSGVFTAPRAGDYFFIWNVMTRGNGRYCYLYLYKNGVQANFVAHADTSTTLGSDSGSNSVVLSLSAGDRVWTRTFGCDYLYRHPFTSFSGFKI